MKLSKNLSLAECTKSNTAIKYGIDNQPNEEQLENLKRVAKEIFQPLREHFGKPLYISSGFRSEDLNKRIGGSKTSAHCRGQALDIDADVFGGVTNRELFEYIRDNLEFDQMIYEFGTALNPAWVHVSIREKNNRGLAMRAFKLNGRTKYIQM